MFSRLVVAALFGGGLAGLLGGILQRIFVQPVLLLAERYETGALQHFGTVSSQGFVLEYGALDWVRDGLSLSFSIVIYIGYALILAATMGAAIQRGHSLSVKKGLIWGVAGFVTFHLAPGFSLPPEVPGMASADVTSRQIWWFATVAMTGGGLWLMAFHQGLKIYGLAAVLLLLPHAVGAPMPDELAGPVPPEIASLFAARAFGIGLLIWAWLGALTAHFMAAEELDSSASPSS